MLVNQLDTVRFELLDGLGQQEPDMATFPKASVVRASVEPTGPSVLPLESSDSKDQTVKPSAVQQEAAKPLHNQRLWRQPVSMIPLLPMQLVDWPQVVRRPGIL